MLQLLVQLIVSDEMLVVTGFHGCDNGIAALVDTIVHVTVDLDGARRELLFI